MDVQCQLTQAEVREAMRMNLTSSFWFRAVLVNLRLLVLVGVIVAALMSGMSRQGGVHWGEIGGLLLVTAFVLAAYGFRLTRTVSKTAKQMNANCSQLSVEVRGLTSANATGAMSFTPWSEFHRWKEGKLVFTVGDAKLYRTIPKSALNEMQVHEVRGLLASQIR